MHVAVIGAGVSGLTIACELTRLGHHVELFEKGQIGGLAGGFPYGRRRRFYLDKFYHHIFTSDKAVVQKIKQYGLERDLSWYPSRSGLIADGKLWRFGSPLDLLRFAPMGSLFQRLRMGWNLHCFTRTDDWKSLDGIRCREFFTRRGNLAAYRNFWEPLLKQKFGDAYDDIPASFLWGRIHPRATSRRKGKEALGYLRGGFQRLFVRMAEEFQGQGGVLHKGQAIQAVHPGKRPELVTREARSRFDRIVWTGNLHGLRRVLADPPADFARQAEAIRYMAATQLILVLKRRLSDFYWLNNLDPQVSFGGLIEHTNMAPPEEYEGKHIAYVVNYHAPGDPRFHRKRVTEVLEHHLPSLERVLPRFRREDILRVHCIRDRFASPLYDLGYAERQPPYQGWAPEVDLCGMSQVYPQDRNMCHGIERALDYVKTCFTKQAHLPRAANPGSPAQATPELLCQQ